MSSRSAPEGAWHGRGPEHFVTRGAEVIHGPGGWYARCAHRVRGPLSCLSVAIEAADQMIADAAKPETPA